MAAVSGARWRTYARRLAVGVLLAIGIAAELARPPESAGVSGAFFGALISLIASAFTFLAGHAVTVLVTIAQVAMMIGTAIARFALMVAGVFGHVVGFVKNFWTAVLRPFVVWSWEQFSRVVGWLQRTFKPLIDFLNDVRAELQKLYDKWLRPIFDTIEMARRTLQILATLRVPFARELDRKLAQLEEALLRPILELFRVLNEAMNWINRILTLDGLVQRLTLMKSIERDLAYVWRAWHNGQSQPLTQGDRDAAIVRQPFRTGAAIKGDVEAYIRSSSGPLAPAIEEAIANLKLTPGLGL